jgi:ABC-2 type transport system ATP-binding protein
MMNSSRDDILSTGVPRRAEPAAGSSGGAAIRVAGLDVSRGGNPVLRDVSMTVPRGAIVGLLGPSGCGKTTLMRAIVGVQAIASGSVTVLDRPAGDRGLRGRIGYVTQRLSVYPDLSVRDNVSYFAALSGVGSGRVDLVIDQVGLGELSRRRVGALSGGEANRASLACALVGDPEVLVLDEPTVGLDPMTREDLWERFRALSDAGRALLISSHVMDEALRCDGLVLMRRGRVLAALTPGELLARTGEETPDRAFLTLIRSGQEGEGR